MHLLEKVILAPRTPCRARQGTGFQSLVTISPPSEIKTLIDDMFADLDREARVLHGPRGRTRHQKCEGSVSGGSSSERRREEGVGHEHRRTKHFTCSPGRAATTHRIAASMKPYTTASCVSVRTLRAERVLSDTFHDESTAYGEACALRDTAQATDRPATALAQGMECGATALRSRACCPREQ